MEKQIHDKSLEYIYTTLKPQRYGLIQGLCCRLCEQGIGFNSPGSPTLRGPWENELEMARAACLCW